jgi:hypothetical protein
MRMAFIAIAAASICAAPASACYNGPMGLGFVGRTAKLSHQGEDNLRWQIEGRIDFPQSRLLIIFYQSEVAPGSPSGLLQQRQDAVRAFLLSKGIAREDMQFAVSRKRPSPELRYWSPGGRTPSASVELTTGCR